MPPTRSARDLTKASQETDLTPAGVKRRFDHTSNAMQVIEGVDLSGKVAIVTGGTSGIGVETARALAKVGAHVFITARDLEKAKPVVADIKQSTGNSKVEVLKVSLESLQSVRDMAANFLQLNLPLHILICNAGVMAYPNLTKTDDGFEIQFAVNHLAHFLMVNKLLPALKKAGKARVVVLSSTGHKMGPVRFDDYNFDTAGSYQKWTSYGQSKTSNVLFAKEFNRLYSPSGITCNSINPGGILTGLQVNIPREEQIAMGWIDKDGNVNPGFKNTSEGASTTVWAAVAPELDGIGGHYLEDCWFTSLVPSTERVYYGVVSHALDDEAAKKLWDLSVKLTCLNQSACPASKCCGGK